MKTFISMRRTIAWSVMIAFFLLIRAGAQPTPSTGEDKADRETAAASTSNDSDNPGAIESMGKPRAPAKKKFPWLIVAGGLVIAGVVLYFRVFKKPTYVLTVTLDEGVKGSPEAGTYSYKKGTVVEYNYTARIGYLSHTVKLDGATVSDSGTITMNADHALEVNATEGLHDDFDAGASGLWAPDRESEWSVSGGLYRCVANRPLTGAGSYSWNYNVYNRSLSSTNYSVTVRVRRVIPNYAHAVLLSEGNNMAAGNGYLFDFNTLTHYYVTRLVNFNLIAGSATEAPIQSWTPSSAMNSGLGAWNTIKVARNGSSSSLTINDVPTYSFTDAAFDSRYVVLVSLILPTQLCEMHYDYVYIDVGSAPASSFSPFRLLTSPGSPGLAGRDSTGR